MLKHHSHTWFRVNASPGELARPFYVGHGFIADPLFSSALQRPMPEHYCIFCCLKGELHTRVHGIERPLRAGEALLHQVGARDVYFAPSPQMDEPIEVLACFFTGDALCMTVRSLLQQFGFFYPVNTQAPIVRHTLQIARKSGEVVPLSISQGLLFTSEWLALLIAGVETQELSSHRANVAAASQLLSAQRLSFGEIARQLGVSREYLSRLFREEYGLSPREYALQTRMEEARRLLRVTDWPQKRIALELGYHDSAAFHRAFMRVFGVTPGEFRAQSL